MPDASIPDCEDCTRLRACDYHLGFADGWDLCAEFMAAAIDPVDPRPELQIAS